MERYLLKRRCADDLQDFIHGRLKVFLVLCDRDQEIGAQRGPNLDAHAVRRVAEESAQAQVLLDPTEEKFDGPSAAVNRSDHQGRQGELVRQEDQRLTAFRVDIADTPQRFRVSRAAAP